MIEGTVDKLMSVPLAAGGTDFISKAGALFSNQANYASTQCAAVRPQHPLQQIAKENLC
jgi:hypothetical protein